MENKRTSKYQKIYSIILDLYPNRYKKRFAEEMQETFSEMLLDAYHEKGEQGVKKAWNKTLLDTPGSLLKEHIDELGTDGITQYASKSLHINKYNVLGAILLIPFFSLLTLDLSSRLLQGNLGHPNQALFNWLSKTPLYEVHVLTTLIVIFPLLAFVINLYSLALSAQRRRGQVLSFGFVTSNYVSFIVGGVGLLVLAFIVGHDMIPCIITQTMHRGLFNFINNYTYCRTHY